ncbi:transglutaminase domain-containing protein [Aromatoleum sp.]|uniref:transglutaminase domain-containing protein n=1 Tax=Aromatoleum sp. TaxID=2307007 RepID=UPI002FC7FD8D
MSGERTDDRIDGTSRHARLARVWFALFVVSSILSAVTAATLVPHLQNSAELVRMRNALLLEAEPAVYEWSPAAAPEAFDLDDATPNPLYAEAVREHSLRVEGDDWASALAIGRHLLASGKRNGGAIQSDLDDTYRRITTRGEGYCGDFADVFTGLANVAGVFSRPWAFSFDGFGGHGHIFNEIWDSGRSRWVAIDVFNNMYFTGENGEPLSAIELRTALAGDTPLRLVRIEPSAPPGYQYEDKAIAYYRRGLPEWYMWWGNNVFEYDQSPIVRTLGDAHRALEQLGGVAAGVHPAVRILETPDNEAQRESIYWLRLRLLAAVVLAVATIVCLAVWLRLRRGAQRESGRAPR